MIKHISDIGRFLLALAHLAILLHSFVPHHHHTADKSVHFNQHSCAVEAGERTASKSTQDDSCSLLKETISAFVNHDNPWNFVFDDTKCLAYFDALKNLRFDRGTLISSRVYTDLRRTQFSSRSIEACGLRGPPFFADFPFSIV